MCNMEYNFLFFMLLFCIYHITSVSTLQIMPRETNSCESRRTAGPICESCELLAICVQVSSGVWVNTPVELCDTQNGSFCNAHLGMCSNATGSCHPFNFEGHFPCPSHGIYPDPYDCQKYHICYYVGPQLVSATVDCGGDKAFNAANAQCSLTLADAVCQQRQYQCLNVGDAHPWPSNPNIYYICKATSSETERVLYPTLYRCEDGEYFDNYMCRAGKAPSTVAPNMPYPTATTAATPYDPTNPRNCAQKGFFADAENCHKYYYCSAVNGVLKHVECPRGTYYNAALSACKVGEC